MTECSLIIEIYGILSGENLRERNLWDVNCINFLLTSFHEQKKIWLRSFKWTNLSDTYIGIKQFFVDIMIQARKIPWLLGRPPKLFFCFLLHATATWERWWGHRVNWKEQNSYTPGRWKKHTQILQLDIKMPPIPDLYFLLVVNKHLLHENLYLATPFLW